MNPKRALILRRQQVLRDLPPLEEVARGSLIERHLRCGNPGCHCAQDEGHRAFYLAVSFSKGRTEQVTVPVALVPVVRRWIDNYKRLWAVIEEVSGINRDLLRRRWIDGGEGTPRGRR
jgi:hypothetical protein